MSATTTFNAQGRYKDQLKLMRAETAASWLAIALDRLILKPKSAPSAVEVDDDSAPRTRWYGAYY